VGGLTGQRLDEVGCATCRGRVKIGTETAVIGTPSFYGSPSRTDLRRSRENSCAISRSRDICCQTGPTFIWSRAWFGSTWENLNLRSKSGLQGFSDWRCFVAYSRPARSRLRKAERHRKKGSIQEQSHMSVSQSRCPGPRGLSRYSNNRRKTA
jgi:hypothetical protein